MTDVTEETVQDTTAAETSGGPGRRLREAREARRLTIAEVASELRMQARHIEALESDDYASLPGATFVQGYLRSYTKLLGLPEATILAMAASELSDAPKLVPSIADDKELNRHETRSGLLGILVLAVLVVVAALWLSQQGSDEPGAVAEPPMEQGGEMSLSLPPTTQSDEIEQSLSPSEEGIDETSVDTSTAEGEDEIPGEELSSQQTMEPTGEVLTAIDEGDTSATQTMVPQIDSFTDLTQPHSTLRLTLEADSWSDISDAAGRKLSYGLLKQGRNIELKGEAPFSVFLGFASGVRLYYNDERFDHSIFQRGDIARFRVGRAADNRSEVR